MGHIVFNGLVTYTYIYIYMLCTSCNLIQVITRTTLAVQVITRTTEPYKL